MSGSLRSPRSPRLTTITIHKPSPPQPNHIAAHHPERENVKLVALDLASFDSIEACAAEAIKNEERIDYLVLNAGIMATPQSTTKEVTLKAVTGPCLSARRTPALPP